MIVSVDREYNDTKHPRVQIHLPSSRHQTYQAAMMRLEQRLHIIGKAHDMMASTQRLILAAGFIRGIFPTT